MPHARFLPSVARKRTAAASMNWETVIPGIIFLVFTADLIGLLSYPFIISMSKYVNILFKAQCFSDIERKQHMCNSKRTLVYEALSIDGAAMCLILEQYTLEVTQMATCRPSVSIGPKPLLVTMEVFLVAYVVL